jgi:tRNA 2-thiouridine synthesizing protein E
MPTVTIAGVNVEVSDEGFMTNSEEWSEAIAAEIAAGEGITELAEGHWKVVNFLREDFKAKGTVPTIRRLKNAGGVPTKELYDLFPGGPLKKASKIAGLKKPASCI